MEVDASPIKRIAASKLLSSNPIVFWSKVIIVAIDIKITGSIAVNTLITKPGVSSNLNSIYSTKEAILPVFVNDAGTSFLASLVNIGPAKITVGIAIMKP